MLGQLILGSAVIFATVFVQVIFIGTLIKALSILGMWLAKPPTTVKFIAVLSIMVLWLVAGLACSSWAWAILLYKLDVFSSLEPALYFSIVTFTTLGYGDITVSEQWRILSSLSAVNGLIIVGLNTAFLVESIGRIRDAQKKVTVDDD